ncbi:methyltransferase RsmF C-terminal domain-like protein [Shivajiella indica]|uniref:tRNA/rRNA cytosine-C5-methylase n=1 Tax=Shivajiella indica TaxID=872115 RepID=A0ABW5B4S3_9BACT
MPETRLPEAFELRMKNFLGEDGFQKLADSLEKEPNTSVRLNPFKKVQPEFLDKKVPWSNSGYFLKERPSFTLDPLFHAGCYYVQEASSMYIDHILNQIKVPVEGVFLDLSAAPGGKATLLSSYLGGNGFLVANEVIKSRANILKENIIKWGLGNTLVTQNDPEHFSGLEGFFDLVLVDAPCSGEGMFRKDPDARSEWSPENVSLCALRQERILDRAGGLVKGGGYLLYSTCTFNTQENEEMLKFICAEFDYEPVRISNDPSWGIVESELEIDGKFYYGYRFYPHLVDGEGFFITVLKRPEKAPSMAPKKTKDFKHPYIKSIGNQECQNLIAKLGLPQESILYSVQESYFWFNPTFQYSFEYLTRFLNIRYFGIELGKFNKNQFIPNHEWAVSIFDKNGFEKFELNKEQALSFLRKEDIHLPDLHEGWILVTFKDIPLGWLKNLGNRVNNYYPKEWRIRNK